MGRLQENVQLLLSLLLSLVSFLLLERYRKNCGFFDRSTIISFNKLI